MKPVFHKPTNADFAQLKREVDAVYTRNYKRKFNAIILANGAVVVLLYIAAIVILWGSSQRFWLYLLTSSFLGIWSVPLILNIGHEAVHGNFTTSRFINKLGKLSFFLVGSSPYFWELRHIYAHHTCTNILNWDLDIEQSSLIRLSEHQQYRPFHRFQYFYMPLAFAVYTLNWFFLRDLKDISKHRFGTKDVRKHPSSEIFFLFAAKIWHFAFLGIVPFYISGNVTLVIAGFLLFHLSASLTTTLILVSTHIGEEQEITQLTPGQSLNETWVEHQVRSTGDFCTESKFMLHFFGGFNHHLAHHLFPNIPFLFYPVITPMIRQYCQLAGLPYHHYSSLHLCVKSHFSRLLRHSIPDENFLQL